MSAAEMGLDADDDVPVAKPVRARKRANPQRRRWIIVGALSAVVVALILVSQWDLLTDRVMARWPGGGAAPRPQGIASYSGAQGAQDAPRSEVPESRRSDRERCLDTLRMRRVALETARDSCEKMVNGIYR